MKTFLAKPLLLIFASLFVFACAEDDDPVATPVLEPDPGIVSARHPVAQVLEGNYWQEKICFTYQETGRDNPYSSDIQITGDIVDEFAWEGKVMIDERLDIFYVASETGVVHAYEYDQSYTGNWYYHKRYWLEYLADNRVRVSTDDEHSAYYGADSNIDLRVVSCTDREIVLDGPIKPYIWQNWDLTHAYEMRGHMYLGIRVYWTKIENGAELLEPSNPLD